MRRAEPMSGEREHGRRPLGKRLTLCVDDFGMHAGVNSSVLLLAALDRIGAVSVLVDGPAARGGAERLLPALRSCRTAPDIGLHLNLTEVLTPEREQAQAIAAYRCMRLPLLVSMAYARALSRSALRKEIHRQCSAFEQLFGRAPDYVDGHQHVHTLPVVREALLQVLSSRYGRQRPWLRRTRPPRGLRMLKPRVVASLGDGRMSRLAREWGFLQNEHLLGVHEFTTDPLVFRDRLASWLRQAQDGDLLMVHPSTWCASPGSLIRERITEHEVLMSPGFEQQLADCGVVLSRMKEEERAGLAQREEAPDETSLPVAFTSP